MADGDKDAEEIPLPNVTAAVLKKVCAYLQHHAENPAPVIEKPLKSPDMKENVGAWDAEYVDVEQEMLFELILAANYLDIKPLLDLACAKVRETVFWCSLWREFFECTPLTSALFVPCSFLF